MKRYVVIEEREGCIETALGVLFIMALIAAIGAWLLVAAIAIGALIWAFSIRTSLGFGVLALEVALLNTGSIWLSAGIGAATWFICALIGAKLSSSED